jgi:hypothetical protein
MGDSGGIVGCFTGVVSLIWNVPLSIFEGDGEASAAGVYRRAHIASFHSNAQLAPADSDTTVAPIMMPRMMPNVNPGVPEVSIRRAPWRRGRGQRAVWGAGRGGARPRPHADGGHPPSHASLPLRPSRPTRTRAHATLTLSLAPFAAPLLVAAPLPPRPARPPARRVVDGVTRVVQVASRVPNRLANSEYSGQEYAVPSGGGAAYPSLLLVEKEEEERAREAEARVRGPPPGSRGGQAAPPPRVASASSVRRTASREEIVPTPELKNGIAAVLGSMPQGYQSSATAGYAGDASSRGSKGRGGVPSPSGPRR